MESQDRGLVAGRDVTSRCRPELTALIRPLDALLWPLLIVCIVAMIVALPCNEVVVVKARCESFAFLHGSSAPADSAVAPRLPAVEAACCQSNHILLFLHHTT